MLACNGPAQKLQLVCRDGRWQELGACSVGENCDRREGACAEIVGECAARSEGARFCRDRELRRCGEDLVRAPVLSLCAARCAEEVGEAHCRVTLAAGALHSCAVLESGALRCWGEGLAGQLGVGLREPLGDGELASEGPAANVGLSDPVLQLAAGTYHSCALFESGAVRCWGENARGQLGYGASSIVDGEALPNLPAVEVGGAVVQLVAGGSHTCALLDDGTARCWGDNRFAQLGYLQVTSGDAAPAGLQPIDVGGPIVQLAAGELHTCALLVEGSVRCWGVNVDGQLGYRHLETIGDDEAPGSSPPVNLGGRAVQLAAGEHHTCAILEGGAVRCWGAGASNLLGYGTSTNIGDNEDPAEAGPVALAEPAVQLSARNLHTCALLESGRVSCWGSSSFGQLGYGLSPAVEGAGPAVLDLGEPVLRVVAGYFHTCAHFEDGRVRCWGYAANGQLGTGSTTTQDDAAVVLAVPLGELTAR